MPFETVPLVHYEAGRLPDLDAEAPEAALTTLARRFGRVVVVDVQGVRRGQPQLEALQSFARRRPVWWDGGSRYATDAMDLFIAGAERVTLRWNTLRDPRELEEAAELCEPEGIFLGLEHPRGAFLQHPRDRRGAHDVARLADQLGVGIVHTLDAVDERALRALPPATGARYVQGPFWGHEKLLEELGFAGALVPAASIPPEGAP